MTSHAFPRRTAVGLRLTFSVLLAASPLTLAPSFAQQAASPAVELDTITIEGQTAKKKPAQAQKSAAAKKTATKAAVPTPVAPAEPSSEPVASAEPTSGTGKKTQPGLNLNSPNTAGSRLGLTPLQTPASVEVISGDTIRERGQQTVNDAVTQNAAGITSTANNGDGGTSFSTRGFAGQNSIAQFYDGTKLYVGAGTVTFPFNTWSADRIEVLRGPASVLYGEGAIGGIINVVPKKPTDTFMHEAEVSIGSDWTRRLSLGSGGPISDKLAYRFDVTGEQSNGWVDDGEFKNAALSGALRYKPTSDLVISLSNDYGYQEPMTYWGTPLINDKLDERLRFKNFNVSDAEIKYLDNWTRLNAEWRVNYALTLRNSAYRMTSRRHWKNAEEYYYDADFSGDGVPEFPGLIGRTSFLEIKHDMEQIGDRFDAILRHNIFGLKTQTVAGFDVNRVKLTYHDNFFADYADYIDPYEDFDHDIFRNDRAIPSYRAQLDQYSLFSETRVELTDQLSVIGGVRLDRPEIERTALRVGRSPYNVDFSEVTWRAGAVYTLAPGLALYGQYSTGIDPLGSLLTLSNSAAVADLTTGRQIEIGLKQSFWNGRGEWTLAGYDIVKDNLLVPVSPTRTLQVGQQSSRGVEFSLAIWLTESLRAEGNVALLNAEYDQFNEEDDNGDLVSRAGNRPIDVPETVANFWLSYKFLPNWTARGGVQYVGTRFSDTANESALPDYAVVNAGLDYAVTENSKLSLRGYNVFDEVYAVTSYGPNWVLGRPRSVDLTYNIKF